jgi:hypothetical protein
MSAAVTTPSDPLLDQAASLADELRDRCGAEQLGADAEDLLIEGFASALALDGAGRRLRAQALELIERELLLAARERELRALLRTLRERIGAVQRAPGAADTPASDDETASQRLH